MPVQPSCFGKSWDPNESACKGGLDPLYTNPVSGTRYREKCSWFNSCSQMMGKTAPAQPQIIPTTTLLQRAVAATPPMKTPSVPAAHVPPPSPPAVPPRPSYALPVTSYSLPNSYSPPSPPQVQQVAHQAQVYSQAFAPPNVAQYGPSMVAMPYQHPASQMPQYLTVPEPSNDNVHWAMRLGRELFRSMVKALGHQLAAHVDSHSIKRHD